jgi:hypothetical protein
MLLALAIQGITPDAHDLASSMALRLLGSKPLDVPLTTDDDGLPDDVCDVIRTEISSITRGSERLPSSMHAVLRSPTLRENSDVSAPSSILRAYIIVLDGPPLLPSRLRC